MLSCDKAAVWDNFIYLYPSGSVNRLGGPKQVTLAALGEGWVEQSPLGVCPLFCILSRFNCYLNSKSVLSFGICSGTVTRMVEYTIISLYQCC